MVAYTFRVLLAFGTILATGCVLKEPYPNQWPDIHAVKGICPDISGTFTDDGWLNPSEAEQTGQAWHKRSLSRLLFTHEGEFDEVTDVKIIQTENHDITLIALIGNTSLVEQSFSIENGDFSCKSGFVEFIGERVCETGNGVMACATPESDLIKNLDFWVARLADQLPPIFTLIDGIYTLERGPGPDGSMRRSNGVAREQVR